MRRTPMARFFMTPPEDVKQQLVRDWLALAREDLAVAEHLIVSGTTFYGIVAFHAQQAVEKYMKAFLVAHEISFRKTHDLVQLMDLIVEINRPLGEALEPCATLSPYSVEVRYPGDSPEVTTDDAHEAVRIASIIEDKILNELVRP